MAMRNEHRYHTDRSRIDVGQLLFESLDKMHAEKLRNRNLKARKSGVLQGKEKRMVNGAILGR